MTEESHELASPRVLVVRGNGERSGCCTEVLAQRGFDVTTVTSADSILDELDRPDVVVMEDSVVADGPASVFERVRSVLGSTIPVLFVCDELGAARIEPLLSDPGTDIVRVPIFVAELVARIRVHVSAHRRLEAARREAENRVGDRTMELRRANEALAAEIEGRKRVEAALRRSEERHELASTTGLVGLWDLDLETNDMYLEPKLKAMLGYADHEIRNHLDDWLSHLHEDDAGAVTQALDAYLAGERNAFEVEHRMRLRDGTFRWFLARGKAIRDEAGRAIRLLGTDTDITQRREMEATIVGQNVFLNSVIEALSHPLYVVDVDDYTIRMANSPVGRGPSVVGRKCYAVSHGGEAPCSSECHPCPLALVRETGRPVTVEHVHRDDQGTLRDCEIHGYPLFDEAGNVKQMIGYSLDITPRKVAERQIRRRNRELTLLNSVIMAATGDGGPEAVMAAACRGLKEAFELRRVTAALFDVGEGKARIVAEDAVEGDSLGIARIVDLREYALPDGCTQVPLSLKGEPVGVLCLEYTQTRSLDASELELAMRVADQVVGSLTRARLAQERRTLEAAIEQTADGIVVTDIDGVITYVNPAFERTSGYERREVVGRKPSILRSGRHDKAFYKDLWETILAGGIWRGRLINRNKSGALFIEDAVITPFRDDGGQTIGFIASERDVTRELELEEHIRQSQKMESIGRLAGGVAHDFNNLLAVILGYAGLALGNLAPSSPAYDSIKEIEETTQRAAAVTRQLLTFARRQVTEPRSLDLREVLANLDRMLQRLIGKDIDMKVVAPEDLWRVKVDGGQIEQVVVNLVINARDAMPRGGRLMLCLANTPVVPGAPVIEGAQPGEYVELSVQDTGVGMSEEVKAHLFEPFFSTKDRERGTGLGLATCFGIVKQSDGHIWAESKVGEGTTIRILFPRTEDRDASKPSRIEGAMPRGTETVFVAEDEDNLRRLACQVLRQLGYHVLEGENGEVALEIALPRIADIDLLVTDVVMPRVSGPELAKRLRERRPELPVIFTSGYTRESTELRSTTPDAQFLTKPFSPAALARMIRDVLDRRPRGNGGHSGTDPTTEADADDGPVATLQRRRAGPS